jgi:hypothetical protein
MRRERSGRGGRGRDHEGEEGKRGVVDDKGEVGMRREGQGPQERGRELDCEQQGRHS